MDHEYRERICLDEDCEKTVPDEHGFKLCARHLAKAWAAWEILNGRTVPENHDPLVMPLRRQDMRGIVYFATVKGQLKIGWTTDLRARLKQHGADELLWCTYGTQRDERRYLQTFESHLEHGQEWFALNETTRALVQELRSKGA